MHAHYAPSPLLYSGGVEFLTVVVRRVSEPAEPPLLFIHDRMPPKLERPRNAHYAPSSLFLGVLWRTISNLACRDVLTPNSGRMGQTFSDLASRFAPARSLIIDTRTLGSVLPTRWKVYSIDISPPSDAPHLSQRDFYQPHLTLTIHKIANNTGFSGTHRLPEPYRRHRLDCQQHKHRIKPPQSTVLFPIRPPKPQRRISKMVTDKCRP